MGFTTWGDGTGDRSGGGGGGGGGGGEGLGRVSRVGEDEAASSFLAFVKIVGSRVELGVWGEASDLDSSIGRGSAQARVVNYYKDLLCSVRKTLRINIEVDKS